MTTTVLSMLSMLLSLVSTGIAIASFRRSRKLQGFDYATRLQLGDEEIIDGGLGALDVFSYSAQLENHGLKPVQVEGVYIDYGGDSPESCFKHNVEGRFHLAPNAKRLIRFALKKPDYQDALDKFKIHECFFRLRVLYMNSTGGVVETNRRLLAIGERHTFYVQKGDALT